MKMFPISLQLNYMYVQVLSQIDSLFDEGPFITCLLVINELFITEQYNEQQTFS